MNSARWLAQLDAPPEDLEDMPRWFPDDPIRVTVENGSYFLTGSAFDDLFDQCEVRALAEAEIDLMAAAARLLVGRFTKPRVSIIYSIDPHGNRNAFAPGVVVDVEARYKVRGTDGCDQRPTRPQRHVAAARANKNLTLAMQLWAEDSRTWPRLYRILEEVELSLGGKQAHAYGLCSDNERERFTRSADHAEVSGLDARHANNGKVPPKKPMTNAEATRFLQKIIVGALDVHMARAAGDA